MSGSPGGSTAAERRAAAWFAVHEALPARWCGASARLELLAEAFEQPYELSPVVTPDPSPNEAMIAGELEAVVLNDRTSTCRDGSRVGWRKVKGQSRNERESWRF